MEVKCLRRGAFSNQPKVTSGSQGYDLSVLRSAPTIPQETKSHLWRN